MLTPPTRTATTVKPKAAPALRPAQPFFQPKPPVVQAKLTVGAAHATPEREADAVADKVVRMAPPAVAARRPASPPPPTAAGPATPAVQRSPTSQRKPAVQRTPAATPPLVQRAPTGPTAEAAPPLSAEFEAGLAAASSGGQPLPAAARQWAEPRFGADFGQVRLHTDDRAARLTQRIGARAFAHRNHLFFSPGQFDPGSAGGQHLLAHELTHVLQQGQAVQRSSWGNAPQVAPRIQAQATPAVQALFGIDFDFGFARKVDGWLDAVPGWRLLTVLLGHNPVLGEDVPRDAAHIMQGVLQLAGPFGAQAYRALQTSGFIGQVTAWVNENSRGLNLSLRGIKDLFGQAWDQMHLRLGIEGNVAVIKRIFGPPLGRVLTFVKAGTKAVAGWLRRAVLEPMAKLAAGTRGYPLFTVLIGQDPLTGKAVPRTADALGHALLALLPEGEEQYQRLKQAKALERVQQWFTQQATQHNLTLARVQGLLSGTLQQLLSWDLLLHPLATAAQLVKPFVSLGADVWAVVGNAALTLLEIGIEAVLGKEAAQQVLSTLRKAGSLFAEILKHPLPFLKNLVAAGWQGFKNFLAHGPKHLLTAAKDWLLGGLAKAGLTLPAQLDVAGIIQLLLQVFNLTKDALIGRLRERLVAVIGAENAERLEEIIAQVGGVAVTLWQQGPAAAWQAISEQAQGLKDQALDMVRDQVMGLASRAVPVFLATLAVPGGAFVQAAKGIYSGVMLFVEKGRQIAQVGAAFLDSVGKIAAGQLAPAALAVENTLVKILPVALSFLAKWLNLDGISGAIQTGLQKVQAPVEKAVTKVLDVVTTKAQGLWSKLKAGAGKVVDKGKQVATTVGNTVKGWLGIQQKFTAGTENHTLFFDEGGQLMLASSPAPYQEFLRKHDLIQHLPATAPLRAEAHKHATNIDRLAQERTTLEREQIKYLQQEKQRATHASMAALPDRSVALTKNAAALDRQLLALAQVTMHLMAQSHSGQQLPRANQAVWSTPLSPQKYGTGVLMEYFTTGPVAPGSTRIVTTGKKPTQEVNDSFGAINLRRNAGGSYYVKGHLLSQQLHGPGKWENLTPLSRSGNDKHEEEVEHVLKTASANYDPAAYNPADPRTFPRAYYYSVVPQYGRPLRQDLLDQLVPGPADDKLRSLITAEEFVPRNLVCVLWEVDAQTGARKRQVIARTVENPVEQAGLFDYQLGRKPATVEINQMQSRISLTPIMGQTLSYAIWDITKSLNGRAISQSDLLTALSTHRNGQTGGFTLTPSEATAMQKTFALLVQRKLITFG
jgi:hypothetical protein